jgi:cytochrome P450
MTTEQTITADEADLPVIDFQGPDYLADPAGVLRAARARSWLARSGQGFQVLSHAVIRQMVADPDIDSAGPDYYRRMGGSELLVEYATNGMLPLIQGLRHDRIRRVLQRGFSGKRIVDMRPVMQRVAGHLIARFADRSHFDLVADFSHHYPLEVLCALIGVPEKDIPQFSRWTVDLALMSRVPIGPHLADIDAALKNLYTYFRELVAERRLQPTDDFVTTLIEAQAAGDELTEPELFGSLVNLLFAGHDTTRYQFIWVIQQLMTHRDQWERVVADPALAGGAVEETLRLQPSLQGFIRQVSKDVIYRGIRLPAGAFLSLNALAANRDPEVFADPDRFDITRSNAQQQLTFGRGAHLCLGNALARSEMTEALKIFARRFPNLSLAGEPTYPEGYSGMRGAEHLPLATNT